MSTYHIPVMLNEVLEYLDVKPGSWYVDCNLGGGGHTYGILEKGGKVIGIDLDPEAIKEVAKNYKLQITNDKLGMRAFSENLILVQGNFADMDKILKSLEFPRDKQVQDDIKKNEIATSSASWRTPRNDGDGRIKISGVFFDLGVSSHQLETPERGFSFNQDAPLDMRMDTSTKSATAADLINGLHEKELAELFWKLGEENFAKPIARAISDKRKVKRIETTNELAQIILSVRKRGKFDRTHPATRVFQALRIAVNDELNSLKEVLPKAFEVLEPGGRLVVISFHSLEDRIVKEYIKGMVGSGKGEAVTKKPIEPTGEETRENPRSRSGKLRVIEKLS